MPLPGLASQYCSVAKRRFRLGENFIQSA
jgi:hypothetical protein